MFQAANHADCIAEGAAESFRVQSWRDNAQAELARWVRFGKDEAAHHLDGLTTAGMETGRKFQRVALMAREHSLAIHPMTQQLEKKNPGRDCQSPRTGHGPPVYTAGRVFGSLSGSGQSQTTG